MSHKIWLQLKRIYRTQERSHSRYFTGERSKAVANPRRALPRLTDPFDRVTPLMDPAGQGIRDGGSGSTASGLRRKGPAGSAVQGSPRR
jgi:hypothetical protein